MIKYKTLQTYIISQFTSLSILTLDVYKFIHPYIGLSSLDNDILLQDRCLAERISPTPGVVSVSNQKNNAF